MNYKSDFTKFNEFDTRTTEYEFTISTAYWQYNLSKKLKKNNKAYNTVKN